MAKEAARFLSEKKALSVMAYDATQNAPFTDYFVLATGRSGKHIASLADDLLSHMALIGLSDCRIEGRGSLEWILLDFSYFIVHLFSREARDFYHIERLFPSDCRIELPEFFPEGED